MKSNKYRRVAARCLATVLALSLTFGNVFAQTEGMSVVSAEDFTEFDESTVPIPEETEPQDVPETTTFSQDAISPVQLDNSINLQSEPTENDVASVTIDGATTYYEDIMGAFAAANGNTATIDLLKDTSFSEPIVLDSGDILIDGHDFTLTIEEGTIGEDEYDRCINIKGATVKVQNLKMKQSEQDVNKQTDDIVILSGGLSVLSGAFGGIYSDDLARVEIYNGTIKKIGGIGRYNIFGGTITTLSASGNRVNISGGTVTNLVAGPMSNINISGGTVTNLVAQTTSNINISDGTIDFLKIEGIKSKVNIYGGNITSIQKVLPESQLIYHPVTTVSIQSVSTDTITVEPWTQTGAFGKAEYSIDNVNWQESNVFPCEPNKPYTVYARYERCKEQVGQTTVTSKQDGYGLIIEPTGLSAINGQKLSDISLPTGWSWVNGDTSVSKDTTTYAARFDTTDYEANNYDFTKVSGYNAENHYVERNLSVDVKSRSYDIWIAGIQITDDNKDDITKAINDVTPDTASGKASFDSESNTLKLENFVYQGKGHIFGNNKDWNVGILLEESDVITLELNGDNSFNLYDEAVDNNALIESNGIFSNNDMIVMGDGVLTVCNNVKAIEVYGIHVRNLDVENVNLIGFSGTANNGNSTGVYTDEKITISGGSLTGTGSEGENSYGVYSSNIDVKNGKVEGTSDTANNGNSTGIYNEGKITISGGSLTGTGSDGSSSYGVFSNGDVTVSDGSLTGTGSEGENSYGVYISNIDVKNGKLEGTSGTAIESGSIGVHARGNITISGGSLTGTAEKSKEHNVGVQADYISLTNASLTGKAGDSSNFTSYGIYSKKDLDILSGEVIGESSNSKSYSDGIHVIGTINITDSIVSGIGNDRGINSISDNINIKDSVVEVQGREAFFTKPNITDFDNAMVWYGDSKEVADNQGAKPIGDLDSNFAKPYVRIAPAHTITFDANGGMGSMDVVHAQADTDYALPTNGFTAPIHKKFKGWSTTADGQVILENTVKVTGDITLYAIWEDITYTVTYIDGVGGKVFADVVHSNIVEGSNTPTIENPVREGYTFKGWQPEVAEKVTKNATYTATWEANKNTEYQVNIYYQENGKYEKPETKTLTGTTGEPITIKPEDYIKSGYVLDEAQPNIFQGTIKGDGSLVLNIYFKQSFQVAYDLNGGTSEEGLNYEKLDYGTKTPIISNPVRKGYTFKGWQPEVAETVTNNATYTATWEANTNTEYKVNIYYQAKGKYEKPEIKTLTGTTDESITIKPEEYIKSGYVLDEAQPNIFQGTIKGDGSLVLNVYFKQSFKVTYDLNGGTSEEGLDYKKLDYGAKTPTISDPVREGYTFKRWQPNVAETVTDNATYTATWEANKNTEYQVNIYYQAKGKYEKPEIKTLTGTTDESITIKPEEYIKSGYVLDEAQPNIFQGTIKGDGSLVLNIYFKQSFQVAYDLNGGTSEEGLNYEKLDYGAKTPTISDPVREGYTFKGWQPNIAETVTDNATYTATWEANKNTEYQVNIYYQANGKYEKPETKTLTGTTDESITIKPEEYIKSGYVLDEAQTNILQGTIKGDGSLVLNVYFKQSFKVTYDLNGGTSEEGLNYEKLDYGSKTPIISNPVRTGYTFKGWQPEVAETVTDNATYTATWEANKNTEYQVNIYYQANGKYEKPETKTLTGTTGEPITIKPEEYIKSGYVLDEAQKNILQGTIKGDGSLVLNVYFKQSFKITYDLNGGTSEEELDYKKLEYGAKTPTISDPVREGYTFKGWQPEVAETVTDNATYTATWEANKNTEYKVNIYYQANGKYEKPETKTLTGTTDESITIKPEEYIKGGYVLDEAQPNIFQGTIKGDGSLVLNVYFKQSFKVTYDLNGGTSEEGLDYKKLDYGAKTPTISDPVREGYTFKGWQPNVAETVTDNATYTATWEANKNTEYKVNIYYQENGKYEKPETKVLTGTTDESITIKPEEYIKSGYVLDEAQPNIFQGTIKGDGSLVLNIYFKQSFQVAYDLNGGTSEEKLDYQKLDYGSKTPIISNPVRTGYTFKGWQPEVAETVTNNATYTATWEANKNTEYKVNIYYQANGKYEKPETKVLTGTTGEPITIKPEEYIKSGYVLDEAQKNILQGTIKGDGSLVLNVYFKQSFKITYDLNGGTSEEGLDYKKLDYGAKTPTISDPVRTGYTFKGWQPNVAETVTDNVTYTATWEANKNTEYKVNVYYQANGKYEKPETKTLTGTTDESITIKPEDYSKDGYVLDETQTNILQGTIKGDGSLVLNIYFKQSFQVAYDLNGGTSEEKLDYQKLDYGSETPTISDPVREGYTFKGWQPEVAETVTDNATYMAIWEAAEIPEIPDTHTVLLEIGTHGSVSINGKIYDHKDKSVEITRLEEQEYIFQPDKGYAVESVSYGVEGKEQEIKVTENRFTAPAINSDDNRLIVHFVKIPVSGEEDPEKPGGDGDTEVNPDDQKPGEGGDTDVDPDDQKPGENQDTNVKPDDKTPDKNTETGVRTGDKNNVILWSLFTLISCFMIGESVRVKRKKK